MHGRTIPITIVSLRRGIWGHKRYFAPDLYFVNLYSTTSSQEVCVCVCVCVCVNTDEPIASFVLICENTDACIILILLFQGQGW